MPMINHLAVPIPFIGPDAPCITRYKWQSRPLLMQWTAPTRRHLGAKMMQYKPTRYSILDFAKGLDLAISRHLSRWRD